MATASSVFASLDAPFINFNKEVEPIVWQGKDILVQQTFELKIPAMCGATIKYSFTTEIGDISFSTEYNTPGQPLEILVESLRVPSDEEKIEGSFKAGRDGTFCMIFDNSYSWFNPKLLTYKVSLYQPEFTIADTTRAIQSRRLLATTIEDVRKAEDDFQKAHEKALQLDQEMAALEARIAALSGELGNKKSVLKAAHAEMDEMNKRIEYNLEKKNGLCIRSLDKRQLTNMLGYLGKQSGAYLSCKYWKACVDDAAAVKELMGK